MLQGQPYFSLAHVLVLVALEQPPHEVEQLLHELQRSQRPSGGQQEVGVMVSEGRGATVITQLSPPFTIPTLYDPVQDLRG